MKKKLTCFIFSLFPLLIQADDISDIFGTWIINDMVAMPKDPQDEGWVTEDSLGKEISISGDMIQEPGRAVTLVIDWRFEEYSPDLAGNLNEQYVDLLDADFVAANQQKFRLITARLRSHNDYAGTGKTADGYIYTNYAYVDAENMLLYGGGRVYHLVRK